MEPTFDLVVVANLPTVSMCKLNILKILTETNFKTEDLFNTFIESINNKILQHILIETTIQDICIAKLETDVNVTDFELKYEIIALFRDVKFLVNKYNYGSKLVCLNYIAPDAVLMGFVK